MPLIEHDGRDDALQIMYAVPDDAWYLDSYGTSRCPARSVKRTAGSRSGSSSGTVAVTRWISRAAS
ncbi:hypothetical protein [Streptomyces sp. NPDC002133]|uniref:hypothetical protein n=1 Tax=Streptomyces sp. NPDC002133 TaxID=3154409 RepID=UPI003319D462